MKKTLRPLDVRYVFALYQLGHTQKEIANEFGVIEPTVQAILKRRNWKSVPIEPELMVFPEKTLSQEYHAGHKRVSTLKGQPQHCEKCGTTDPSKRYEWASISGDYGNSEDYMRLCLMCHKEFDGFANVRHGEDSPQAKLTEEIVREIKRRYVKGSVGPDNTVSMAKEFGVNQRVIWQIVTGRSWKHVS